MLFRSTSAYKFYQYWLNTSDEDAASFIRIFTHRDKEEIDGLIAIHKKAPHERKLQLELAKDITIRVHTIPDYDMAVRASSILFGNSVTEDLQSLDENTLLSVLEGVPQSFISKSVFEACTSVTDLLSEVTKGSIFPSKGEARRMIRGGGVSINKVRVEDPDQKPDFKLLQNRYLLAQKGKKNYYLITVN